MTIEKYIEENPDFDIYNEVDLEFANPSDSYEAEENLEYILDNGLDLHALAVVIRSYYGDTIKAGKDFKPRTFNKD